MDTYYHSSCESLQYHRIQYIIVQFESIQFLEIATFLISLPLSTRPLPLYKKTLHNPEQTFTLHPSIRHNRAKIQTRPNPPICSVLNEHRGEESGRGRTNSRNKPEELVVVIRGFWIKAGGGGCQKKKKAGTYPSMVALALSFLSWAVAMVCGPDDIAREICRHCATARTTRG